MRVNLFLLVIALLIGGLIYYCFYVFGQNPSLIVLEAGTCTLALIAAMGIRLKDAPRETAMFKTGAILWFLLLLIVNSLLLILNAGKEAVVILNGLLTLGGVLVLYFIYQSCHESNNV